MGAALAGARSPSDVLKLSGGGGALLSGMIPVTRGRFDHVDAMRAASVMLVVLSHAGLDWVPGDSGVTIFFVISGFVITRLLLREREREGRFDLRGFYWRRFLKLAPPFVALVILPTAVYGIFRFVDWAQVAGQTFFVFNWVRLAVPDSELHVLPGSGVVWSLAIEEQFYIVFALVWVFLSRARNYEFLLAAVALGAIVTATATRIALSLSGAGAERIAFGTDARMDSIAIGVLIAILVARIGKSSDKWSRVVRQVAGKWYILVLCLALYIASLVIRDSEFRETLRYSFQSIAAAGIILYGMVPGGGHLRRAFNSLVSSRLARTIGLASYSIYLAHYPVIYLLEPSLRDLPLVIQVALLATAGCCVGILSWYVIERPVERWKIARTPINSTRSSTRADRDKSGEQS